MGSKAQGSLEYLLLIGGAVLVAAVVISLIVGVGGSAGEETKSQFQQVLDLMRQSSGQAAIATFSGTSGTSSIGGNIYANGFDALIPVASGGSVDSFSATVSSDPVTFTNTDCTFTPQESFVAVNCTCSTENCLQELVGTDPTVHSISLDYSINAVPMPSVTMQLQSTTTVLSGICLVVMMGPSSYDTCKASNYSPSSCVGEVTNLNPCTNNIHADGSADLCFAAPLEEDQRGLNFNNSVFCPRGCENGACKTTSQLPDLVITSASVVECNPVHTGYKCLDFTIRNQGTGASTAATIGVCRTLLGSKRNCPSEFSTGGSFNLPALQAGQSINAQTVRPNYIVETTDRISNIDYLFVDSGNVIAESDETNNGFDVLTGPFCVSQSYNYAENYNNCVSKNYNYADCVGYSMTQASTCSNSPPPGTSPFTMCWNWNSPRDATYCPNGCSSAECIATPIPQTLGIFSPKSYNPLIIPADTTSIPIVFKYTANFISSHLGPASNVYAQAYVRFGCLSNKVYLDLTQGDNVITQTFDCRFSSPPNPGVYDVEVFLNGFVYGRDKIVSLTERQAVSVSGSAFSVSIDSPTTSQPAAVPKTNSFQEISFSFVGNPVKYSVTVSRGEQELCKTVDAPIQPGTSSTSWNCEWVNAPAFGTYGVKITVTDSSGRSAMAFQSDAIDVRASEMSGNVKDSSKYFNKEVFLVSDNDWKPVLSLIPASVWTDGALIVKHPLLIYHDETANGGGFDADSIIHFMGQYNAQKVTIVGASPRELDNVLAASGFQNLERIQLSDLFDFWSSFDTVILVEDNYELALMASVYASLLNVPVVIRGSALDSSSVLNSRRVICVGAISGVDCAETYDLAQLQKRYVEVTKTDKFMLLNPNDLTISTNQTFETEKSATPITQTYTKNSLGAAFLASARREVIITTSNTAFSGVNNDLKAAFTRLFGSINDKIFCTDCIGRYFFTIVASPNAIPLKGLSQDPTAGQQSAEYQSLDQTRYFNPSTVPAFVPLKSGRILGISVSDVSSYIARDLFYNEMPSSNKIKLLASGVIEWTNLAKNWQPAFSQAGFDATVLTSDTRYYHFDPAEFSNNQAVIYIDDGSRVSSGIYSWEMPKLENSILAMDACSTCSIEDSTGLLDKDSFCAVSLRKGGIAYFGNVDTTIMFLGCSQPKVIIKNAIFAGTLNNFYRKGMQIGKAFEEAYRDSINGKNCNSPYYNLRFYETTFLGDPALEITPTHTLANNLWWVGYG